MSFTSAKRGTHLSGGRQAVFFIHAGVLCGDRRAGVLIERSERKNFL